MHLKKYLYNTCVGQIYTKILTLTITFHSGNHSAVVTHTQPGWSDRSHLHYTKIWKKDPSQIKEDLQHTQRQIQSAVIA